MKRILILLLLVVANFANAGEVGNGGDPLRLLFEEARKYAAEKVQNAEACAFNVNTEPQVVSWIMEHKSQLAADILMSQHVWITDTQSTCAFTQTHAQAPITFSFETCRPGIKGINDAIAILAHESVHHFGSSDEVFADKVGRAIASLGINGSCNPTPSADPFNPASCTGTPLSESDLFKKIPLPNQNTLKLGNLGVYSRYRTCYAENWCTVWLYGGEKDWVGFWAPNAGQLNRTGEVILQLRSNIPVILTRAKGDEWNSGWEISNIVNTYNLKSESISADMHVGYTKLSKVPLTGWVTNSCLRQIAQGKRPTKDNLGNDIFEEYETVILSRFNN